MRKGLFVLLILLLCVALFFVVFYDIPNTDFITTYGDSVHEAVKEHYEAYEILGLVRLEKDGKPTLQNFCIINDMQGKMVQRMTRA